MEKMILIAGKDYPDGSDFSSTAVLKGDLVVITTNADSKDLSTEDGSVLFPWNRASALSSRSLVLNCVNKTGKIDEAYDMYDMISVENAKARLEAGKILFYKGKCHFNYHCNTFWDILNITKDDNKSFNNIKNCHNINYGSQLTDKPCAKHRGSKRSCFLSRRTEKPNFWTLVHPWHGTPQREA